MITKQRIRLTHQKKKKTESNSSVYGGVMVRAISPSLITVRCANMGSTPITSTILGYSQVVKASVFDSDNGGSIPPSLTIMLEYLNWLERYTCNVDVAGSTPASSTIIRLVSLESNALIGRKGKSVQKYIKR